MATKVLIDLIAMFFYCVAWLKIPFRCVGLEVRTNSKE